MTSGSRRRENVGLDRPQPTFKVQNPLFYRMETTNLPSHLLFTGNPWTLTEYPDAETE
ncbi:MAG: hypothetical protein GVY10_01265 [Verrucomicrobia bacterium]|nr:hypothetical protein [Verrucomicrobiota bacterium]